MPSTASALTTLLFGLSLLAPVVLVLAGIVFALITRSKIAHRRHLVALAEPRLQARFLHQAHDPFAADMLMLLEEILVDARTPVALFALGEGRPHQHSQSTVVARMRRFRARARRIEAAGRDVQRPTKSLGSRSDGSV